VALLTVSVVAASAFSPQYRMLNGEKATVKPFQFFLASSSPTQFDFGSASLITFNHVITAGKLVAGYQKWILAYGETKFASHTKRIETRFAILHPGYNNYTNENDLAIIFLPSNTPRDFLRPISLPNNNIVVPRYNEEGSVSGFGVALNMVKPTPNEDLKTSYFTVIKENECPIAKFQAQETSNFCARDYVMNSRLCKGDTGTAFVILQRGIPVLAGITSQVSQSCVVGDGHDASSFLRVHSYLGWIKTVTGMA